MQPESEYRGKVVLTTVILSMVDELKYISYGWLRHDQRATMASRWKSLVDPEARFSAQYKY